MEDISTDEYMKITSSDIDVEMITTEESAGDSGFLPVLSTQNRVFKNQIQVNTLLSVMEHKSEDTKCLLINIYCRKYWM